MSSELRFEGWDLENSARELRRLVRGILGQDPGVDDVVQETFLVAARHDPRSIDKPVPWLKGVARNLALRWRSHEARRRGEALEDLEAEPRSQERADLDALAHAESLRTLLDAVQKLPANYRTPVIARHLEGCGIEEIAGRLDVSRETVRTRLRRGLIRLREELQRREGPGWERKLALAVGLGKLVPAAGTVAAAGASMTLTGALVMNLKVWLPALIVLLCVPTLWWLLDDEDADLKKRRDLDHGAASRIEADDLVDSEALAPIQATPLEIEAPQDAPPLDGGSVFAGPEKSVVLSGRCLRAEDHTPLPGCRVSLKGRQATGYPLEWEHYGWRNPPETVSRADGRFSIRLGLPIGKAESAGFPGRLSLSITHPERAGRSGTIQIGSLDPGGARKLGDLLFERGSPLRLEVVDEAGRAAYGVEVTTWRQEQDPDWVSKLPAVRTIRTLHGRSDDQGHVIWSQTLAPGTWKLRVEDRELVSPAPTLTVSPDGTPVAARLVVRNALPAHSISGRLVDLDGKPIANTLIKATTRPAPQEEVSWPPNSKKGSAEELSAAMARLKRQRTTSEDQSLWARTTASGRFLLLPRRGRPSGDVMLMVAINERYEGWGRVGFSAWGRHGLDVRARPEANLVLRVEREDDGTPVQGYFARLLPKRSLSSRAVGRTRCDSKDGAVQMEAPTGEQTLEITPFDRSLSWRRESLRIIAGERKEVVVRLPVRPVVEVRVTSLGGRSLGSAELTVTMGDGPPVEWMRPAAPFHVEAKLETPRSTLPVHSDSEGRALLSAPKWEHPVQLRVRAPGHVEELVTLACWPPNHTPLEITLRPEAIVRGRLTPVSVLKALDTITPQGLEAARRFGKRDQGFRLSAESYLRTHRPSLLLKPLSGSSEGRDRFPSPKAVGEDGRFEIRGIRPGSYALCLALPRNAKLETGWIPQPEPLVTLTLSAGETRPLELDISRYAPDALPGNARLDGTPLGDASLEFYSTKLKRRGPDLLAVVRTDATGVFLPKKITPGRYRVVAVRKLEGDQSERIPYPAPVEVTAELTPLRLEFQSATVRFGMKNGKREGPWIHYFDFGGKRSEGSYRAGLREGEWRFYRKDGTPSETFSGTYEAGVLQR